MDITIELKERENDLIQACLNRERWAQKQLYESHYGKMMSICLRYATNHAEAQDVLHEGFIKVFKNLHKYQTGTSLNSWISRIMVNTSIDHYRKNVRRRTEDIETAFSLSTSEADAISKLAEKEILKAVQKLSPAYRLVFNLYVIEGFSHKEVAEKLGITSSTSRSNLVKARGKLKAMLKADELNYGE